MSYTDLAKKVNCGYDVLSIPERICSNCRHLDLTDVRLICDKHGFRVSENGVCFDFQKRGQGILNEG